MFHIFLGTADSDLVPLCYDFSGPVTLECLHLSHQLGGGAGINTQTNIQTHRITRKYYHTQAIEKIV